MYIVKLVCCNLINGLQASQPLSAYNTQIGQAGTGYATLKRLALSSANNNMSMLEKAALFSDAGATASNASAYAQPLTAYPNGPAQIIQPACELRCLSLQSGPSIYRLRTTSLFLFDSNSTN
jgi:hypothetical protein